MELLYNPDAMPIEEIKATFVGRQWLVDELIQMLRNQPEGAGLQHVIVVGARGMGKTTVLLALGQTLTETEGLASWQAVKFSEETYRITDAAEFWMEAARYLGRQLRDSDLLSSVERINMECRSSADLHEAAQAVLKDWQRRRGKRLLLLVENFDMILEQIDSDQENARLRDVLMNQGTAVVIGTATSFFREARAYDQPLYNFFKLYNLEGLSFSEIEELLLKRANLDGHADFPAKLTTNRGRLRALAYFTAGNPRLVLMLYRVATGAPIIEVRNGLEKLLDDVTPFFKAKMDSLPAQQRKILDQIARVTSETHEGSTPKAIAEAVRMPPNQVSAQLQRLAENGYVRAANVRGRSTYYTLSEPLFAVWYQMRFGREARERMGWLISFLKVWYDTEELHEETGRLETRFNQLVAEGLSAAARGTLEHWGAVVEAIGDSRRRIRAAEDLMSAYLKLRDIEGLRRDLLPRFPPSRVSKSMRKALLEAGCITREEFATAERRKSKMDAKAEAAAHFRLGEEALEKEEFAQALEQYSQATRLDGSRPEYWARYGLMLAAVDRVDEALAILEHATLLAPADTGCWASRGMALMLANRHPEALKAFDRAVELVPQVARLLAGPRALLLWTAERFDEARAYFDDALEAFPADVMLWYFRGRNLAALGRYEEAMQSLEKTLSLEPANSDAQSQIDVLRIRLLIEQGRFEELSPTVEQVLARDETNGLAWQIKGILLTSEGQAHQAIDCLDRAVTLSRAGLREAALLERFSLYVATSQFDAARADWKTLVETEASWRPSPDKLQAELLSAVKQGHAGFVRELVSESKLAEDMFPLLKALDYVESRDEAIIEKLSPEVRGIVKEIAAKLKEPGLSPKAQPGQTTD